MSPSERALRGWVETLAILLNQAAKHEPNDRRQREYADAVLAAQLFLARAGAGGETP